VLWTSVSPFVGTVCLPPLPPNFPDDGEYYVFTQSYLFDAAPCRRRPAQFRALDRSIDRKVKILLTMRKEHARECRGGSRTAPTQPAASPPDNESSDREAQELSKLVGLDDAEVAPNFSSAGADPSPGSGQALKVSATTAMTESPAEENAAEISKSPEQSENVIENKGPAPAEVKA
jgi:hypothetical protein